MACVWPRSPRTCSRTNGSSRLPIRLPEPVNFDLGLVWRTGQAGICMLDRERDQLRPIFDPTRGQSARRLRTRCLEGARVRAPFSPRGTFEREFESVETRRLRVPFVLLDAFLSSMSHHQVLCLHACCLSVSVLSARCLRHISVVIPSKPVAVVP